MIFRANLSFFNKILLKLLRPSPHIRSRLPYILSIIAGISGSLTYWALTHNSPTDTNNYFVLSLIYIDLVILLLLAVVIARRLAELWTERRLGLKGSKLHIHIVALFAFVSITPAIIVALFSAHFLNTGVDAWFGKPVRDALQQASVVAESYLKEHKKVVYVDALALANQFRSQMSHYLEHPDELTDRLNIEADGRKLAEIVIYKGSTKAEVIARSYFTFQPFLEDLTASFKKAKKEDIVLIESTDRVRVIMKLDSITDTYLLIGKLIDPIVLQHVDKTYSAIKDYRLSAGKHTEIQVTFVLFFTIVALLLLMAAIWVGLTIADLMVKPIIKLIEAAQAVSEGDLSVKLETQMLNNEIDDLSRSFNRMTHQLLQQQHDLRLSEKKSAWADMARKIAHEIKNPLTPIQLSAERLKRRYLKEIKNDPETFQACIDTIIRQVSSIGSLVNEFSNFARMPEPKLESINWVELCKQAIFLQQQAHPKISISCESTLPYMKGLVDPLQMNQVLTNLLQNSINALLESESQKIASTIKIKIHIQSTMLYIRIEDSGPGFPENIDKLMEPYYTTREHGTGLGLAIVSKIISDHSGRIELARSSELGGAAVILSFPIKE